MKLEYEEISNGFLVTIGYTERKVSSDNFTKDFTKEIVSLIKQNPEITTTQLAEAMNVTRRTIANYIQTLKQEGKITRIDGRKNGTWVVKD
jgi:ATP-dependent DNA helicase RecG